MEDGEKEVVDDRPDIISSSSGGCLWTILVTVSMFVFGLCFTLLLSNLAFNSMFVIT